MREMGYALMADDRESQSWNSRIPLSSTETTTGALGAVTE